jgi:6-methylsalicylate decarboxylase
MNQSCLCGRRHILLGGLAAALIPAARAESALRLIDVHHHIVPPAYVDAVKRAKLDNPPRTSWTPEKSL